MTSDAVVEILDRLIETCRDAEHGFLKAADAVVDSAIKRLFIAYAAQRARFARELETDVRRFGGSPRPLGGATGTLQRVWTSLWAALTVPDEDSVIAAAERAEASARRTYQEALSVRGLPVEVRTLIAGQHDRVKQTHEALRTLKEAA